MTYEEYEKLRDEHGMTNYQVAALANISRATLSQWKNGNAVPGDRTIKRLQDFFNGNYPPVYKTIREPIKNAHEKVNANASGNSERIDIIRPMYCIDSYMVRLDYPEPIELSEKEYKELKKASEAFAYAWLLSHRKIKPEERW